MNRWLCVALLATGTIAGQGAMAEEACKTTQLTNPAPTLSEMYAMAQMRAKAWKNDAVPVRIGNTMFGPLKPDGSSAAWNLVFYSEGAKASIAIGTFRGALTCFADAGTERIPDLKADFFCDGAKLYALAKQHGAGLLGEGYAVMIQTASTRDRHATWYINYLKDRKNAPLSVIVDANTGAVEKVVKT